MHDPRVEDCRPAQVDQFPHSQNWRILELDAGQVALRGKEPGEQRQLTRAVDVSIRAVFRRVPDHAGLRGGRAGSANRKQAGDQADAGEGRTGSSYVESRQHSLLVWIKKVCARRAYLRTVRDSTNRYGQRSVR